MESALSFRLTNDKKKFAIDMRFNAQLIDKTNFLTNEKIVNSIGSLEENSTSVC